MENNQPTLATDSAADIVPGTLSMLILKALANGTMHGAAIAETIHRRSGGALHVKEGALYPALHRLELRKWVEAEQGLSENKRNAKFYRLTPEGARAVFDEYARWTRMIDAIATIMETRH